MFRRDHIAYSETCIQQNDPTFVLDRIQANVPMQFETMKQPPGFAVFKTKREHWFKTC